MAGRRSEGEARLDDIAAPSAARGVVGIFVDREKDEAGRSPRAPELACRFDAVQPRHGNVEHDDIRMEPLRLREEFGSIADPGDYQTFTGQHFGRHREHGRMIISQQHARSLRRAGVGDGGNGDHSAPYN